MYAPVYKCTLCRHSERGERDGLFSGSTTPLGGSLSGSIERYTSGLDGGSLGSSLSGSIELDGRSAGISFAGMGTGSQLSEAATYLSKFEQEMSGVAGLRATGGGEGARLLDLSLGLGGLFCRCVCLCLSLSVSLSLSAFVSACMHEFCGCMSIT